MNNKINISKDIYIFAVTSFIALIIKTNIVTALIISILLSVFFYKLIKKEPEHKTYAQFLSIIAVIVIIASPFTSAIKSDTKMRENKAEIISGKSQEHRYITKEESIERSIELKVIETIGVDSKINEISISENELYIEYQAKENFSNNLTKIGIYGDMLDMTEKLSKISSDSFNSILYSAQLDLVDTYGNTSNQRISLITIKKATWEKINYDNFLSSDLETIADTFYLHPAF